MFFKLVRLMSVRVTCGAQWAVEHDIDVRILSDCNSEFITHMLSGAGAPPLTDIITNSSQFIRVLFSQVCSQVYYKPHSMIVN
jgi:hypothetical protein